MMNSVMKTDAGELRDVTNSTPEEIEAALEHIKSIVPTPEMVDWHAERAETIRLLKSAEENRRRRDEYLASRGEEV